METYKTAGSSLCLTLAQVKTSRETIPPQNDNSIFTLKLLQGYGYYFTHTLVFISHWPSKSNRKDVLKLTVCPNCGQDVDRTELLSPIGKCMLCVTKGELTSLFRSSAYRMPSTIQDHIWFTYKEWIKMEHYCETCHTIYLQPVCPTCYARKTNQAKINKTRRTRHHRHRLINKRLGIIKNIWKADLSEHWFIPGRFAKYNLSCNCWLCQTKTKKPAEDISRLKNIKRLADCDGIYI